MFKILATAAALSVAAVSAQAATYYASSVDAYTPGTGITDPNRSIQANALGAPDGDFLSLGLGGSAVFGFGNTFGSPGAVFEVTFGVREGYIETANVFGILGGVETALGAINNATGTVVFTFTGIYDQLKLVDTSPKLRGRDGFDIDSIKVSSVPLPAGGLLLVGAIGGLAALRRRKALAA